MKLALLALAVAGIFLFGSQGTASDQPRCVESAPSSDPHLGTTIVCEDR